MFLKCSSVGYNLEMLPKQKPTEFLHKNPNSPSVMFL